MNTYMIPRRTLNLIGFIGFYLIFLDQPVNEFAFGEKSSGNGAMMAGIILMIIAYGVHKQSIFAQQVNAPEPASPAR